MMLKKFTPLLIIVVSIQFTLPAFAEAIKERSLSIMPENTQEAFLANLRLIEEKNKMQLLQSSLETEQSRRVQPQQPLVFADNSYILSLSTSLIDSITLEASYVLASQFMTPGDPAQGAINNVYGDPTWVVPRENALAILSLIESAKSTDDASYLERASLAADYLIRVQDQSDGGWYDQYDHTTPVSFSKSPTQTAEVMMALYKLGYNFARYESMKKGMQFLLSCQDPLNKGGQDDGLLGGGKDSNGNFYNWRWASDNSFAYQALRAAKAWAVASGDLTLAAQAQDAADKIVNGINTFLYINNPSDPNYGVWKRAIDGNGVTMEPDFIEWINYAPQMLDLPVTGAGSPLVGEWIHTKLQQADGAVVWDNTWHSTRKSPGFSFQASFVWRDLGQNAYADAAVNWAVNSGLWQTTPDQNGITGGWIDWTEPADQAPFWQRFIDTSFYSIAAFKNGYDFSIGSAVLFENGDIYDYYELSGNRKSYTNSKTGIYLSFSDTPTGEADHAQYTNLAGNYLQFEDTLTYNPNISNIINNTLITSSTVSRRLVYDYTGFRIREIFFNADLTVNKINYYNPAQPDNPFSEEIYAPDGNVLTRTIFWGDGTVYQTTQ